MKTALLLIDIQNDYFHGGKMELANPLAAAKKAYGLLQCFREHGEYHVHIQHVSLKPDATFFISGWKCFATRYIKSDEHLSFRAA